MMVASFLLIIASSFPFCTFTPIAPLILSAFSKTFSNVPYSANNLAAVFSPTPGIPGILSTASPIIPKISITWLTSLIFHFVQTSEGPIISTSPPW